MNPNYFNRQPGYIQKFLLLTWVILFMLVGLNPGFSQAQTSANNQADTATVSDTTITFDYELDPYYSNAAVYFDLARDQIPRVGDIPEWKVYRRLLATWYKPSSIILEASVNPMPIAGVYAKKHNEELYNEGRVGRDFHMIRAITAGFNDPYALSLFFGNVLIFSEGGDYQASNKAYMGFLFTGGDQHIRRNELLEDDWLVTEWKIKGDRQFTDHTLSWSFRVGGRFHSNPVITDTWYLSLRRGKVDFAETGDWWDNSEVEYTVDFAQSNSQPIRHLFLVGKRFPLTRWRFAFSLGFGVIWDSRNSYDDPDLEQADKDDLQLLLRPNIVF